MANHNGSHIIWITGCKGGVGKTITARIIMDLFQEDQKTIYAYDCDSRNPQFKRFYGAEYLPILDSDQRVADHAAGLLAQKIEERNYQIIIIDSPAGEVNAVGELQKRFRFVHNLKLWNARLTRVFTLGITPESVNLLKYALEDTQGLPIQYIAIRNLHFGKPRDFDIFNQSKTKNRLIANGGQVIDMQQLGDFAADDIERKSLTYQDAVKPESGLTVMQRGMVFQWREAVRDQFAQADALELKPCQMNL